jgi:hypothetical protein
MSAPSRTRLLHGVNRCVSNLDEVWARSRTRIAGSVVPRWPHVSRAGRLLAKIALSATEGGRAPASEVPRSGLQYVAYLGGPGRVASGLLATVRLLSRASRK